MEPRTPQLSEASVALLLEHRQYHGCTMASLTIRERLEVIEKQAAESALRRIREGVAGLRELSDAATPGEWTLCPDLSGCECGHGTQSVNARGGEVVIAEFRDLTDPPNEAESNNTEPVETRRANAAFIVEAVAFVRTLLIDTEIGAEPDAAG